MKQALHIFGKDVRHLWVQIVVATILVACRAVLDVRQTPVQSLENGRINLMSGIAFLLLLLAWWSLIAAALYEETLPGDRQFWVTRPYSWRSLLGAKLLFVMAFVCVPLFASDCYILAERAFPVWQFVPDLLLREVLVGSWLVLPAFALASVTRGMSQFGFGFVIVWIGIIAETVTLGRGVSIDFNRTGSIWVFVATMLAIAGAIFWQYARRQTAAGRAVLAGVALSVMPALMAFAKGKSPERPANQETGLSGVRISYDLSRMGGGSTNQSGSGPVWTTFTVPVLVSGLPPGTALIGNGRVVIGTSSDKSAPTGELGRVNGSYFEQIYLDEDAVQNAKLHPINLHSWMRLTLVTDTVTATAPFPNKNIVVPGVGLCDAYRSFEKAVTVCRSPVQSSPTTIVWLERQGVRTSPVTVYPSRSALNKLWGPSPVDTWLVEPELGVLASADGVTIRFTVQQPLAEITRDLNAENVNLAPYLH